ncbi:MAG: hypothetical protein ACK56I_00980, partial [bacterium]
MAGLSKEGSWLFRWHPFIADVMFDKWSCIVIAAAFAGLRVCIASINAEASYLDGFFGRGD